MIDKEHMPSPRIQSLAMWGLITLILLFWVLVDVMVAHASTPPAAAASAEVSLPAAFMGWVQTAIGIVSAIAMVGVLWGVNKTRLADHEKRIATLEAARETDRKELSAALEVIKSGVNAMNVSIARLQGARDEDR